MANINGTDISLMPNDGMKSAARRYKKLERRGETRWYTSSSSESNTNLSGKIKRRCGYAYV